MTTTASPDDVERFVYETLSEFGPERDDVVREASLEALDLDSLDVVELSQVVEEKYEVDLKPAVFKGSKTVGDLLDRITSIVCAG